LETNSKGGQCVARFVLAIAIIDEAYTHIRVEDGGAGVTPTGVGLALAADIKIERRIGGDRLGTDLSSKLRETNNPG
jgi:hypothetical protein